MMDYRYIYLLIRIRTKAIKLISAKVFFAENREQRLYTIWGDNRFTIGEELTWWRKWCKVHIKIGIATDVDYRIKRINESKLHSGKTEYFTVGLIELICVFLQICFMKLTDVSIISITTIIIFLWISI